MFNLLREEELVSEMKGFAGATDEQLHAFKTIMDVYDPEVKLLLSGVNEEPSQGLIIAYTKIMRLARHLTALRPILENNSIDADDLISMLGADFAESLVTAGILCEVAPGYETDQYAVTGKAYRFIKIADELENVLKSIIETISHSK